MASAFSDIKVVQTVPLEVNLCVWVLFEGYPWWPARVLDWKDLNSKLDPGETVDPPNGHNSLVEWFDPERNISVFDNNLICEYTTNIHLAKQSSQFTADVLESCRVANKYLETNPGALGSQIRRYKELKIKQLVGPGSYRTSNGLADPGKVSHLENSHESNRNAVSINKPVGPPRFRLHKTLATLAAKRDSEDMNTKYRKGPKDPREIRDQSSAKPATCPEDNERPSTSVIIELDGSCGATEKAYKKRRVTTGVDRAQDSDEITRVNGDGEKGRNEFERNEKEMSARQRPDRDGANVENGSEKEKMKAEVRKAQERTEYERKEKERLKGELEAMKEEKSRDSKKLEKALNERGELQKLLEKMKEEVENEKRKTKMKEEEIMEGRKELAVEREKVKFQENIISTFLEMKKRIDSLEKGSNEN